MFESTQKPCFFVKPPIIQTSFYFRMAQWWITGNENNVSTGLYNVTTYQSAGGIVSAGSHYAESSAQCVLFILFSIILVYLFIRMVSRTSLKIHCENWSTHSIYKVTFLDKYEMKRLKNQQDDSFVKCIARYTYLEDSKQNICSNKGKRCINPFTFCKLT